jgi:hypothetical protein
MFKLAGKVVLLLWVGISFASAQALDTLQVQKQYRPWVTYTSARLEKIFNKGSSLFAEYGTMLEFQGLKRISQDEYNSLNENYSSFLWVGYEHSFTKHWYAGVSEKANFVTHESGSFFTRINASHRGHIGKLFFYKEIAFEYLSYASDNSGKAKDQGRFSPSMGLGRHLKIKGKPLYIGVNYRLFFDFFYGKDTYGLYDKRKIDRTKLKAEISYGVLPHWYIGAYYLRDTEYYCACGGDPAYKVNRITEGVGFILTYLLYKEKADKYITDLPVR